jgi:hypothetical protein
MTCSFSERSACPFLLDVLPELHKSPRFFVELDLHLVELLKLFVLAGTWTTASSRGIST